MNLIKKQITYKNIGEIFEKHVVGNQLDSEERLFFLYDLVAYFRPKNPKSVADITLRELLDYLIEFDNDRRFLCEYLNNVLEGETYAGHYCEI